MYERRFSCFTIIITLFFVCCSPSVLFSQSTDTYNVEINCDAQKQLLEKLKACASLVEAKKGFDAFKKHEQKVSTFVRSVPGIVAPPQAKIGLAIGKSMAALTDLSMAIGNTIFDSVVPNLRNQIYQLDQIVQIHGGYEVDCGGSEKDKCRKMYEDCLGMYGQSMAEECLQAKRKCEQNAVQK